MASITIGQVSGLQVEHTDNHGDKPSGIITVAQGCVDAAHHALGALLLIGEGAEEIAGDGHQQGCGNTLSRNVTYTEVEAVVADKEVVEVASHLLGGCHRAIDINVLTFRKCRISLRYHGHLYITGNGEFALHGGFFGSCFLEFLYVTGQRQLHVGKRVAQLIDFIMMAQYG